MSNQLLDIEDDLNRLSALLGLMDMAAGDLGARQSKALSWGLDHAQSMTADLLARIADLRDILSSKAVA